MRAVARHDRGYLHEVEVEGGHTVLVDEPLEAGGENSAPSPTRLVAAGLASCIAITMRMYALRKEWDLAETEVGVDVGYENFVPTSFTASVHFSEELSEEQRARLMKIARKCPVHKLLANQTPVTVAEQDEPIGPVRDEPLGPDGSPRA